MNRKNENGKAVDDDNETNGRCVETKASEIECKKLFLLTMSAFVLKNK
jgi:hypothetical protein